MDIDRKRLEPKLICTCSSLYLEDIQDSINVGWDDVNDIMADHSTHFRCSMCKPIIQRLVNARVNSSGTQ